MIHFRFTSAIILLLSLFGCDRPRPKNVNEIAAVDREASKIKDGEVYDGACTTGLAAFKQNLYPLLRENCVKCHEASGPGPAHSVADPTESYLKILSYQNFADIERSHFVTKGGDLHCKGYGFDCKTGPDKLIPAVRAWWDGGEKTCASPGRYKTDAIDIPANLPPRGAGFARLRWDLKTIDSRFTGDWFEIEIQKYSEKTETSPGSYLLRRPRILLTGDHGLDVKSIRILLNGLNTPQANAFVPVSFVGSSSPESNPNDQIWRSPLISSRSLLLMEDRIGADRLSIAFGDLIPTTLGMNCLKLDEWKSNVYPITEVRNCNICHGGGASNQPGQPMAVARFPMNVSPEQLCSSMLGYATYGTPSETTLIDVVVKGANGHPKALTTPSEAIPSWTNWIRNERVAFYFESQDYNLSHSFQLQEY